MTLDPFGVGGLRQGGLRHEPGMQMSLMPTESPQMAGLDIAGRCQTVNHVGGDFFQYFQQNDKLSVCLADVTGHAMADRRLNVLRGNMLSRFDCLQLLI